MTRSEAIAKIVVLTKLSAPDLDAFLACTDDERSALVEAYATAGIMPSASAWEVVIAVLKECVEIANIVVPLEGAIAGVFGIVQAAKGST